MRKVKSAFALLACAAAVATAAPAVEVDGVAAKVGAETILRSDVAGEMMRRGLKNPSLYRDVLDEMIERKLIVKAAADAKMTMQEWIIDNRVREIVQKAFGGDRNRLVETLGRQRISFPEWRARLKEDMIVSAMRWNTIDRNVTASPAEMKKAYESDPDRYASNGCVTVSVIMLKPEERVRRDEIFSALKDKSFAELGGKTYADVRPEDVFQPEICAEIAAMPKGTVSKWIELDGWSFLLRKDDERRGRRLSFDEAYDAIEADVKEAKAKAAYTAWVARLRKDSYVKVYGAE